MALNEEFYDKIVAKIVKEGERDNFAKFVLSGNEALAAAKRYFYNLEADKKKKLLLEDDRWFVGSRDDVLRYTIKTHMGLSVFKIFASSLIPFVEELRIINTHLKDYSFLKDIKHLHELELKFKDQEYEKVLSGLSSLQSVDDLSLDIKNLNLQFLSSLPFLFNFLSAKSFTFEAEPKCAKIFPAQEAWLYGDKEAMNDFIFTRENFQHYAAVFPNATKMCFQFYVKVIDDVSGLIKVSSPNYATEVNVNNRNIRFYYEFYDYSGFPESKALKMIEDDENWDTDGCPYLMAINDWVGNVCCHFPLAVADVRKRIANNTVRRIPTNRIGNPEDYYRLIIENIWEHKAEFEVLNTISVKHLFKAYRKITGIKSGCFWFKVRDGWISNGTVADNFEDGDTISFEFRDEE